MVQTGLALASCSAGSLFAVVGQILDHHAASSAAFAAVAFVVAAYAGAAAASISHVAFSAVAVGAVAASVVVSYFLDAASSVD